MQFGLTEYDYLFKPLQDRQNVAIILQVAQKYVHGAQFATLL